MSGSEVVARRSEPVGKLVRTSGRTSSILGVPEQHKRALSPKDTLFKPATSTKWLDDLEGGIFGSGGVILVLDAAAALFVGVPWSITAAGTAPAFWSVYGLSQIALWAVPGLISVPYRRGRKRNFKALVDWLNARYGIRLSSKQGLARFVSGLGFSASATYERSFMDASGQVLALHGSLEKGYRVHLQNAEGEWVEYPRTAGAKAPQQKKAAATALPKDLRKVHDEVLLLVSKLNQRVLSPESDHVVNRAERDIEKVVTLYGDLQELNVITDVNLEEIQQVFNQLRAELVEVFQREAQWTLNALKVETTYVKAREQRAGVQLQK